MDFRDIPAVENERSDRYARQRLIPWWDQKKLASARVLVAGAGAVGNEAIKNLALLGVGKILIVDFDHVEASNLSRCVLFCEEHIGAPKAQAAAQAVSALNPEVEAAALVGDISCDLGAGEVREYDIVLGCLDSIAARWTLNRLCRSAGIPWINAGISATVGEVSLHDPHAGACYECGMTRSMWHRMNQRHSCLLVGNVMPESARAATSILASITAAMQVQEAIGYIHRDAVEAPQRLQPGEMLAINTMPYEMTVVASTLNPFCAAHDVDCDHISSIIKIPASPDTLTVDALLDFVPESIAWVLTFDMVTGLECARCGTEPVLLPLRQLRLPMLTCPQCGGPCVPCLAQELTRNTPMSRASLQQCGVPHQAILTIRTAQGLQTVELLQPRPQKQMFAPAGAK